MSKSDDVKCEREIKILKIEDFKKYNFNNKQYEMVYKYSITIF